MGTRDKRVDAYIANAREFAPILERAREWIHEGCPDCEETLKWRSPTFMHNGIMCGVAAFKAHCIVHFWKGTLLSTDGGKRIDETWGDGGKLTKLTDLPSRKEFIATVKRAAALNEGGAKVPKVPKVKKPIDTPPAFLAALKKNKKAHAAYEAFPPSHKREYLEWITDAKTDATRDRRIAQAVEWIAEGKPRNWKYMSVGG